MAEFSKKSKPLPISPMQFLLNFYFSESCPLSEYTIKLFNLAGFLAHVKQFSRLLDKFEVWVSCEAVWDIFDQFFCLIFLKWNSILCQIYWILDLQLLKLVCFMVATIWKRKYADSWLVLTRSFQDGDSVLT